MNSLTLILGGARSGKSAYAEQRGRESGGPVLFIATAQPLDDEMRQRIARHRAARPAGWRTLEAATEVAAALGAAGVPVDGTVILDCVTLLVSNLLMALPRDASYDLAMQHVQAEVESLLAARQALGGRWLVVSNEAGMGVVPAYPLGRMFRDALGWANQRLAASADEVLLMVAGIPVEIKRTARLGGGLPSRTAE
jgi:adenosylcobinamide kinase/adenosylcobinamide-phosphate guanylyltransferase